MFADNPEKQTLAGVAHNGRSQADDDDTLRFESDGRGGTVVRNARGHVVYPSYVPPSTESPVEGNSSTSPPPLPPLPEKDARRQDADQDRDTTRVTSPKRSSTLPNMPPRRISHLPSVLHSHSDDDTTDSDSTSSSEDEPAAARTKKNKRKTRAKEESYRRFHMSNQHYSTKGKVKRDGRLSISLKDTSGTGYLAKALGTAARKMVPINPSKDHDDDDKPAAADDKDHYDGSVVDKLTPTAQPPCPPLNIVIMVIGSRGDAQPFLKIGKILKEEYGHRVRIATHPAFREFVEKDSGLEFFSVGGDPSELMSFMVKNPGMIPTLESVKAGDIGRRRAAMAEMFGGFWRACINATDDEKDTRNIKMMGRRDPFVADAIIANPPSFAHIHCAEALGIPLHLMFTFPYTPTQAFPHPLASIKKSNVDPGYTNFMSYPLVELMVWQGLGDLVNDFRVKTLGLDPVSTLWAPGATYRLHVPFTYLWSPGLVPKPEDWGDEVDVSGFVFLDLASSFTPPDDLEKFLEKSDEPLVYIGFGSIVVDDANRFTEMIFEAVEMAGVRALVSKGWGGLGGDSLDVPENVFMLDNTPHDWLFPKVRACVIHGGAGTTAIALKCGKPTMIVPFFGDQHFWGTMVGSTGAGPEAVPYKELTAEKLAEGIKYCLTEEARKGAEKIAKDIEREGDGANNACQSFHKGLVLRGTRSMRCSILPDTVAVWQMKETGLRLSAVAAELLVERGLVSWKKLRLLRHNEWNDFEGPGEPVTGVAGSIMGTVGNVFGGIGGVPYRVAKSAKRRKEKEQKKRKQRKESKESAGGNNNSSSGGKQANENNKKEDGDPPRVETSTTHALDRRNSATASTISNPAEEVAHHIGRGALKSAAAVAKAPVNLSLALAQGFHNAPRLYGDDTVRKPIRVTGIKSGLRAARHEFAFGIYDGWTGVVRLPYRGARDGGVRGFITGVGMGLTGFVLKDIAALIGPVGYTLKGVVKQAERGKQPVQYIRRARIVQGERDLQALTDEEKKARDQQAIKGWGVMWQLWDDLEKQDRKGRRSFKAEIGGKHRRARKRREWGLVFESVEVAQRTLEALRKGESIEDILAREGEERKRYVRTLPPPQGMDAEGNKLPDQKDKKSITDEDEDEDDDATAVSPGSSETAAVNSKVDGTGTIEDKTNPFSAAAAEIAKNKEENRSTMEAIEIKVRA